MKKRVRINFSETTKAVQCDVSIEYEGESETIINDEVLKETEDLFQKALSKTGSLTVKKLSMGK